MAVVSPTVAAALLGAVLTGGFTLLIREYRRYLQDSRQRRRLRVSLISEINAGARNISSTHVPGESIRDIVPRSIYTQNADSLGLLSEDEIESVARYYARARHWEALNARILDAPTGDKGSEIDAMGSIWNRTKGEVRTAKEDAIEQLEANMS